jgi:hypothetical protein
MPYPQQTFTNITALLNYINTQWVTNGIESITGVTGNNVVNALAQFIVQYTLNSGLGQISNSTGAVVLSSPITVFNTAPTSVSWPGNVQNEYYMVNATGGAIPLAAGYSYTDPYGTVQTVLPPNASVHIAKMINGGWVQVNNIGGGGSGSGLPPQTGHNGQSLFTSGTSAFWSDPAMQINGQDANWINSTTWVNGSNYTNPYFSSAYFLIFWNDAGRYLLQNESPAEWGYVNNGFQIFYPGFNAQADNVNLFLLFKGAM